MRLHGRGNEGAEATSCARQRRRRDLRTRPLAGAIQTKTPVFGRHRMRVAAQLVSLEREPCGFESLELGKALPQSCQAQDVAALLSGGGTL